MDNSGDESLQSKEDQEVTTVSDESASKALDNTSSSQFNSHGSRESADCSTTSDSKPIKIIRSSGLTLSAIEENDCKLAETLASEAEAEEIAQDEQLLNRERDDDDLEFDQFSFEKECDDDSYLPDYELVSRY